jgi:hypothetical protein
LLVENGFDRLRQGFGVLDDEPRVDGMGFGRDILLQIKVFLQKWYDFGLLRFDPAQSIQLRAHHLLHLLAFLLDLACRRADAHGRHIDDVGGAPQEVVALALGDDEERQ